MSYSIGRKWPILVEMCQILKKNAEFCKSDRISKFQHILERVRILDFFNVDWHMC